MASRAACSPSPSFRSTIPRGTCWRQTRPGERRPMRPRSQTRPRRSGRSPLASGSADSALLLNLAPGAYTMQISGVGQTTGVALGEVYEVGSSAHRDRQSVFARAGRRCRPPHQWARHHWHGPAAGARPRRRSGVGRVRRDKPAGGSPSCSFSIPAATSSPPTPAGPQTSNAAQVAAAAATAGAFALTPGSADSALLVTLQPGNYTVVIAGAAGATGVALAETYIIP